MEKSERMALWESVRKSKRVLAERAGCSVSTLKRYFHNDAQGVHPKTQSKILEEAMKLSKDVEASNPEYTGGVAPKINAGMMIIDWIDANYDLKKMFTYVHGPKGYGIFKELLRLKINSYLK